MRSRLPLPCVLVAATVLLSNRADPSPSDTVLVRCGDSVVEASGVLTRFARLSASQRQQFGHAPTAQLRGYVEQVIARDVLLSEQAKRSKLSERPRVRSQYQGILRDALIANLTPRVEREAPVTAADIQAYYDAHPELFMTKERVRIARLLVDTAEEATALIERVRKLPNMDEWRNLVREKSKDKATSERGGDLGFVAADGSTDVPELAVDPALFAAAKAVTDGEIVDQPVTEGKRFAVVWRRGSVAGRSVALGAESARIRQLLVHERVEGELDALLTRLRAEHVRDHRPELLNGREFASEVDPRSAPSKSSQPQR
jgi:peptidyl-prolyl cis-trans isomerase C